MRVSIHGPEQQDPTRTLEGPTRLGQRPSSGDNSRAAVVCIHAYFNLTVMRAFLEIHRMAGCMRTSTTLGFSRIPVVQMLFLPQSLTQDHVSLRQVWCLAESIGERPLVSGVHWSLGTFVFLQKTRAKRWQTMRFLPRSDLPGTIPTHASSDPSLLAVPRF